MSDGTCSIPCYEEENDCNITVVKVFLAKNSDSKDAPPILYKLNPILWHGLLSLIFRKLLYRFLKVMVHREIEPIKQSNFNMYIYQSLYLYQSAVVLDCSSHVLFWLLIFNFDHIGKRPKRTHF